MIKNMYEIFEEFAKAETRDDKIAVLRQNNQQKILASVLKMIFDETIQFEDDFKIPFHKLSDYPVGMAPLMIHDIARKFPLFIKDHPMGKNIPLERRITTFVAWLEMLEEKEAKILAQIFKKHSPDPNLNADLVNDAFPGLLSKKTV